MDIITLYKKSRLFVCWSVGRSVGRLVITVLSEDVHRDLFGNPKHSSAQGSVSHLGACDNLHVTRERGYPVQFRVELWVDIVSDVVADPHLLPIGLTNRGLCGKCSSVATKPCACSCDATFVVP
jgi:hypothetical protein